MLILALAGTAQLVRIMRANLLDELRRPYVVTARARGLAERRVILKYPVRAALNPFASTIGYLLPYTVSGSVIISVVLSLPTVGPLLLQSLISQDMLLGSTIILLLGVLTVIGTLLSDLLLMWIDPRIRLGQTEMSSSRHTRTAAADGSAETRVAVATQRQLIWWRFRKHRLAVVSAVIVGAVLLGRRCSPTRSPTPNRSIPRRRAAISRRSRSTGSTPTVISVRRSMR